MLLTSTHNIPFHAEMRYLPNTHSHLELWIIIKTKEALINLHMCQSDQGLHSVISNILQYQVIRKAGNIGTDQLEIMYQLCYFHVASIWHKSDFLELHIMHKELSLYICQSAKMF